MLRHEQDIRELMITSVHVYLRFPVARLEVTDFALLSCVPQVQCPCY